MDFENISPHSFVGKLLRLPLKLIPANAQMPILSGKLQGKKWIVGAGRHGSWLGTYEAQTQHLFTQTLNPGMTVFDIGAQAGFYTLLASHLVGKQGRVFAFEPLPRNLTYLHQHLAINHLENVTVIEAAVAETSGVAFFKEAASSYQGKLSEKGGLSVKTISLDDFCQSQLNPVPQVIKMDIEGAEYQALKGARQLFARAHPTLFLAIHGQQNYQRCTQILTQWNYRIQVLNRHEKDELPDNLEAIAYYQ
ncbi:MAG: FkbM family methyltransferase [Desertifilum sp.]|nr:FkbM family methyltransferase [Desertifilum sp.]